MNYNPKPMDIANIELSPDLKKHLETLAMHVHDLWAEKRISEGWKLGNNRNYDYLFHSNLVPYGELSEKEKDYDRLTVEGTLKAVIALGFRIEKG